MDVAELGALAKQDDEAAWVSNLWDKYHHQRAGWLKEVLELRNYIFATDTTTTSNSTLPWKNKTTIPKLCQIRDNLHANYVSTLFPNDNWLTWMGYDQSAMVKEKAQVVESYMANKCRESAFRTTISQLLLDYIDYGVAFSTTEFKADYKLDALGKPSIKYLGPVARRVSPEDIVFNPLSHTFEESHKVVRSIKTIGELKGLVATNPEYAHWADFVERRELLQTTVGGIKSEDFNKAVGLSVDGFGSYHEYLMSDYVEILEFFGDYHNPHTGELRTKQVITIADRTHTVRSTDIPNWFGSSPINMVGWRKRPDNLWAMGPLANLVGLQYRLDHLENLKADAMDLIVHPPLKIIGDVEEFEWGPSAEIQLDEGGDVGEVAKSLQGVVGAASEMEQIEARMELYAGAPREAMGMRTAGEKTAFEVQTLANAASRIFQEKITQFEVELLEPTLNDMLEVSRRNLSHEDLVPIFDEEFQATTFQTITKEDIVANGKLRPVGARHFAKQSQDLANLVQVFSSPLGQMMMPHTSAKALTRVVEDLTGLSGYGIFGENIGIKEQQKTQGKINEAEEQLQVEEMTRPI